MSIAKDYLNIELDDIIAWCTENNQLGWLEKEANKKVASERYSRRIKKLDDDGNVVLNSKGNPVYVADKASPVKKIMQPITFVQLKYNFCEKFMADKLPKAANPKEPTMLDKIKAAAAAAKK